MNIYRIYGNMNKTLLWPEIRGQKFDPLQKLLPICVSIVGVDLFNVTSLNVILHGFLVTSSQTAPVQCPFTHMKS